MTKSRAIRFSEKEDLLIEEFIQMNPLFDFSSLARTAILGFIQNPKLTIKPIKKREMIAQNRGGTNERTR